MPALQTRSLLSVSVAAILLALYWGYISQCPATPLCSGSQLPTGYLGYDCAGKPHHASWESWWHPQRNDESRAARSQDAGTTDRDWNILYHLGGNGPWVEKVIDVVDGGIAVPEGCEVEQVHMMSRHAERYPTKTAGKDQRAVVQRMKHSGIHFNGSLSFFNDWELFWDGRYSVHAQTPNLYPNTIERNLGIRSGVHIEKPADSFLDDSNLEQLTNTGPFSGRLGSFATGVRLRTRYHHLLDQSATPEDARRTTFWASGSKRVIETARHFALGFFGIDWESENTARLEVISEKPSLAADTLTPGRTCPANKKDVAEGKIKGYRLMGEYRATYLKSIRERLRQQTSLTFTDQELFSMQEICGFETTVRGRSPWCSVFTRADFLAFEYARDLLHYYRAGPGQKYAAAMGWLWLNATTNLLLEGAAAAGPFFFSFVHDGDIAPMMTALDVINDDTHLPTTHIAHDRKWRKSQVSPMGGRVIFELLSCAAGRGLASQREKFVRLNVNDGITALPDCQSGPGKSCPLAEFAARTKRRGHEVGDFRALCGLGEDAADRITFLHQ